MFVTRRWEFDRFLQNKPSTSYIQTVGGRHGTGAAVKVKIKKKQLLRQCFQLSGVLGVSSLIISDKNGPCFDAPKGMHARGSALQKNPLKIAIQL